MSLLTVLRSPSSENTSICTDSELEEDIDGSSPRSRTSSFEGFFASKGSAFSLPDGDFARKASKHGGEMQLHLQSMVNLLRDDDILRLVVKLEGQFPERVRYLTVVSAFNEDDVEESIAMGIDWLNSRSTCTIGLVLPLWRDTAIELDGDGGFILSTNDRKHIIKPVSVQTMWTAVQWIHRCSENARKNNQYPNSSSHQWSVYYSSRISSDQTCINEWFEMEDVNSKLFILPIGTTQEQELTMKLIKHKLKEVMMKVDLEEITSRQIRQNLEEEMQIDLKEYKQYIDEEMLTILGQLDYASQIYDHVYLGSEWNASNLEELKENGVGYILNISREIDNFFYGTFKYFNIRLYDEEESDLMSHWENSYKFINEAKINGSKVLVHCKMGISRSASTVIAYGMKEYGTSLNDTMKHVKAKRAVVNPNAGFWKQLVTYEGILKSSKHRYNKLFTSGRRRTSSVDLEGRKGVKRRRNRRQNKFNTITLGEKLDSEVIVEDNRASTLERSMLSGEDEVFDRDMDEGDSPSSSGCDQREEVLKTWQNTLDDSNPSSPSSSRPQSPDLSKDELDDTVGGLTPSRKVRKQNSPSLHRARSVPSLVGDASKSVDITASAEKPEGLHRCNSLRELLSGKVAALKKDYREQTSWKHSNSLGSIEDRNEHPPSPEKDLPENTPVVIVEKTKLHSTLSDPTGTTAEIAVIKSELEPVESEKEDAGSVPDQSHSVVHRDAHIVVKSGTVKRQSRNFEEGKVNLPWDWEEALNELNKSENEEHVVSQESELAKPGEQGIAEDEPPVGLVKMHAQKFQGNFDPESKKSVSEAEDDIENKMLSPEREKTVESLFSSGNDRKVVVVDANSTPVVVTNSKESESDRIKEEMQKAKALFEKDVKKVNEDMIKERSKRRVLANRKSVEIVEGEERLDSRVAVESQESNEISEVVSAIEESSPSEDPLPGTVLKHLQAIEHKYRKTVTTKYDVVDAEENSSQRTESEQEPSNVSKTVRVLQKSEENDVGKVESPSKKEAQSSDKESFDVDVLLRRVNDDMKKEKEQRREGGMLSDFKVICSSSEEEHITKDVVTETENPESLKEQDDSECSEIPRPGIVKRSTDLLLGKRRLEEEDKQDETTVTNNKEDESKEAESSTSDRNTATQEAVGKDSSMIVESDTTEKGLVKKHALVYEGRLSVEVDEEVEDSLITEMKKPSERVLDDRPDGPGVSDDVVDSTGIVSVKLRLQLMEEVIQGANAREYHKQRTRNALAALEDKRERIETEQKRKNSENEMKEREKIKSSDVKDESEDSVSGTGDKKVFFISSEEQGDPSEAGDSECVPDEIQDSLNTDQAPCFGNVRLRTMVLEERIHGSTESLSTPKPGTSIRRHESLPRSIRLVDRPIVRQRSLSDLDIGSGPSTSKSKTASTNRWSLDLRRDKNKIAQIFGNKENDVPDNDRDSEKFSDDMSEKSDKTDDCLSKPSDIFELGDKDFELSKEQNQVLDLDNKDISSLS